MDPEIAKMFFSYVEPDVKKLIEDVPEIQKEYYPVYSKLEDGGESLSQFISLVNSAAPRLDKRN